MFDTQTLLCFSNLTRYMKFPKSLFPYHNPVLFNYPPQLQAEVRTTSTLQPTSGSIPLPLSPLSPLLASLPETDVDALPSGAAFEFSGMGDRQG
jgi:hypothetical protein